MSLSNDLILEFVKTTNDNKTKKNEKTSSYGTVVEHDGEIYVKLDGSDLLTPVDTTTELRDNDRVVVDINNHNALVTGSISNPSVGRVTVDGLSSEIKQTEDNITLIIEDTEAKLRSEISQTNTSLTTKIEDTESGLRSEISQTNTSLTTKIEDTESGLRSEISQTASDLTLMFKDGYNEGSTIVNENGIRVMHSEYDGYTHIAAHGFSLYKNGKAILDCSASGLNYTGTITASDIISTDGTFKIDKNGNITGASLTSSKGDNFSIDENGIITASGLAVEGNISTNTIICNEISNKAYPKTLTGTVKLWVDQTYGDDDSECVYGATFKTFQALVDSIPKNLNGTTVNIYLSRDYVGDVKLTYFFGGRINIFLGSHTLNGSVLFYFMSAPAFIYGGDTTGVPTTKGIIYPSVGLDSGGRTTTISVGQCVHVGIYYLEIWAADIQATGLTGHKVAISANGGGEIYMTNVAPINCDICARAHNGAHIHSNQSWGVCNVYGFQAATGGKISFGNNDQCGGKTASTNKVSGGQIWTDSCSFLTSGDGGSGATSAPTTTTTTAKTYTSSSAQALQYAGTSSAFWRTDCKPKAGDWGYGAHTGWWFFGDDFENVASKNVSKVEITFTREKAGNYAATACDFYVHNYETQPSTKSPTYDTSRIASASVAASTSHTISITDATIISQIKSAKGICTVPTSQSSTYYSVFSATMKVKFTYTT